MTEGKCPSCGAPVGFTAGSAQILVCEHCQTVVARKGPALEARGKVAAIVDTDSPIKLRAAGRYQGTGFTIIGHVQKDRGGAPWDEWFFELDDGRFGWLSESEGQWNLMFPAGTLSRPLSSLRPGVAVQISNEPYVVEEVARARTVSAAGQLPSDVSAGEVTAYVDATGPGGAFATLDYGASADEPEVFLGQAVPFESLGLSELDPRPRVKKAELLQARCTQCNAPLALRAPDHTRRVACPSCSALLDVSAGKLSFLQALLPPEHPPLIALGRRGTLQGVEWTCIGFAIRSCTVEGTRYPWDEYLLYEKAAGFRWLMSANGHWTFLSPIAAGEVKKGHQRAHHRGQTYALFQEVEVTTDYVLGEFFWELTAGERATAREFIAPPKSINEDATADEVTFTLGEYLAPAVVQEAFKLKEIGRPMGIAPAQPNPLRPRVKAQWMWAVAFMISVVALHAVVTALSSRKQVLHTEVPLAAEAPSGAAQSMYFSPPFELPSRGNLKVEARAPVSNSWLGLQGDLVNETTGEVVSFYSELSRYSGSDVDGPWSEGADRDTEFLSALAPGTYVLRVTPFFDRSPQRYSIELTSDVPRFLWVFWALLLLLVGPVITSVRSSMFESGRWSESNLQRPHGF